MENIDLKEIVLEINGIKITCYDVHKSLTTNHVQRCIKENKFQFESIKFLDNENYVDVGAHNGLVSFYLAMMYPNISIHAFECNPVMIKAINLGIEKNKINNIKCYPFGLSDSKKSKTFGVNPGNTGGSSFLIHSGHVEKLTLELQSFEEAMDPFEKIKYLKMDIEGEEFNILSSLKSKNSDLFKKVELFNIEFHDGYYPDLKLYELKNEIVGYLSTFKNMHILSQ